ncbi:MAG: Holliday junction resolvase RuvX [Ruminococcaceae bacterium]|nr:Holliday junction resolvase RuvX [Oscillospiraceae bacterium]
MKLMGIDYGDARIGIALSDPLCFLAQGWGNIKQSDNACREVAELVKAQGVDRVVVGLPKNMNNTEGASAEKARSFAEKLGTMIDAEIVFWDERLTTVAAHGYLSQLDVRGKKRKNLVDTVAATLILEGYMSFMKRTEEKE